MEAYKAGLTKLLSETIAVHLLADKISQLPGLTEQQQIDIFNEELEGSAAGIRNSTDLKRMMDNAALSPSALDKLRDKGKKKGLTELMEELADCQKAAEYEAVIAPAQGKKQGPAMNGPKK